VPERVAGRVKRYRKGADRAQGLLAEQGEQLRAGTCPAQRQGINLVKLFYIRKEIHSERNPPTKKLFFTSISLVKNSF